MTRGCHRTFRPSASRFRPSRFSIPCNQPMQSSGSIRVRNNTTALTKSGPEPGGHASVRYRPLALTGPSDSENIVFKANLIVSVLSRPRNGKLDPRETRHVFSAINLGHHAVPRRLSLSDTPVARRIGSGRLMSMLAPLPGMISNMKGIPDVLPRRTPRTVH